MSEAEAPPIRIRLDLTDFVSEPSRYRWMHLPVDHFSTVADLAGRLREEYPCGDGPITLYLEEPFCLPSWESIRVLRDGDIVKVKLQRTRKKKRRAPEENGPASTKEKRRRRREPSSAKDDDKLVPPALNGASSDAHPKPQALAGRVNGTSLCKEPSSSSSSSTSSSSSSHGEEKVAKNTTDLQSSESGRGRSQPCAGKGKSETSTPKVEAEKKSSSSSPSSSSPTGEKGITVSAATPAAEGQGKRRRKRKRKRRPKNRNLLKSDQTLDVGGSAGGQSVQVALAPATTGGSITAVSDSKRPACPARLEASSAHFSCEDVLLSQESNPPPSQDKGKNKNNNKKKSQVGKHEPQARGPVAKLTTSSKEEVGAESPSPSVKPTSPPPLSSLRGANKAATSGEEDFSKLLGLAKSSSTVVGRRKEAAVAATTTTTTTTTGSSRRQPQDYELLPPLEAMPKLGERIAFKALEILEDYTPGLSGYKEAEVVEVEGASVTLWVKEAQRKEGKFELLGDNDGAEDTLSFVKTYSWSELVMPKLIRE